MRGKFGQKEYLCTEQQKTTGMRLIATTILALVTAFATAQEYETLFAKGVEYIKEQNFESAAESFEEALPLADGENEKFALHVNLAYSRMMAGYTDKALESYSEAIRLHGYDRNLLFQRAAAYMQAARPDDAIEDCNTIINNNPEDTEAMLMRAEAHMAKGENGKAQKGFIEVMNREPGNLNARLGLAMTYKNEKLYEKASLLIGLLIEEFPGNAALYIARSDIEREEGLFELALIDIDKAIEIDPDNAEYYTLQAILLENCGKRSAAAKSRNKAELLKSRSIR